MEIFSAILAGWKALSPEQRKAIGRTAIRFATIIKKRLVDSEEYTPEEIAALEEASDLDPTEIGGFTTVKDGQDAG